MSQPTWKLINDIYTGEPTVVWRKWSDGREESCSVTSEQYLKWVEEGNSPLPADEGAA